MSWWSEWFWALLVASGVLLIFNGGVALTILLWVIYLLNGYRTVKAIPSDENTSELVTHTLIGVVVVVLSIGIKLWVHGGFAAIFAVIGFILVIGAIVALIIYLKHNKSKIKQGTKDLLAKAKDNLVARKKKLIIIGCVSIIAIIGIVLLNLLVIPSIRYDKAVELYNNGDERAAYEIFVKNGNFKDSDKYVFEYEAKAIQGAKKGDIVSFGRYYSTTSKNDIEWIVVNVNGSEYTLISKYCLDVHPFHKEADGTSWADCELNDWLNTKFINEAFNETEQDAILSYSPANGSKVFIPSKNEAETWFESYKDRQAEPTSYADSKGAYDGYYSGNRTMWWLRTQGYFDERVYVVDTSGDISEYKSGMPKDSDTVTIRPVIVINIG